MKEIIIDNKKYFAYSEEEFKVLNNSLVKNINEYPKIISFINKDVGFVYKLDLNNNKFKIPTTKYMEEKSLNSLLNDDEFKIYQVSQSENETFTIGDNVKNVDNKFFTITQFMIDYIYGIVATDNNNSEYVEYLKRIEYPLFTTEDNVKIYNKDQYVYGVCTKASWQTGEYCVSHLSRAKNNEYPSFNESIWKFFSTKELRDNYRNDNIPKFSKKQIVDAMLYSKHKNNGDVSSIMSEIKFKEKLNIK